MDLDRPPGLVEVDDHPSGRDDQLGCAPASSRTGSPPMPMLPSASSAVPQRPSPGSASKTSRRNAAPRGHGLVDRLRTTSIPSAVTPWPSAPGSSGQARNRCRPWRPATARARSRRRRRRRPASAARPARSPTAPMPTQSARLAAQRRGEGIRRRDRGSSCDRCRRTSPRPGCERRDAAAATTTASSKVSTSRSTLAEADRVAAVASSAAQVRPPVSGATSARRQHRGRLSGSPRGQTPPAAVGCRPQGGVDEPSRNAAARSARSSARDLTGCPCRSGPDRVAPQSLAASCVRVRRCRAAEAAAALPDDRPRREPSRDSRPRAAASRSPVRRPAGEQRPTQASTTSSVSSRHAAAMSAAAASPTSRRQPGLGQPGDRRLREHDHANARRHDSTLAKSRAARRVPGRSPRPSRPVPAARGW